MCRAGLERAVPRPGHVGLSLRAWGPQSGQWPAAELQSQTRALGEMDSSGCRVSIIGWGTATER